MKDNDTFTLFQDFRTKQSFWIQTKDNETTCTLVGADDLETNRWNNTLTMVNAPDRLTYILLRELLVLGRKVTAQTSKEEIVRSMHCKTFGFHNDRPEGRDSAAMTWTATAYPKEYVYHDPSVSSPPTTKITTTPPPPATPRKRPPPGITGKMNHFQA